MHADVVTLRESLTLNVDRHESQESSVQGIDSLEGSEPGVSSLADVLDLLGHKRETRPSYP